MHMEIPMKLICMLSCGYTVMSQTPRALEDDATDDDASPQAVNALVSSIKTEITDSLSRVELLRLEGDGLHRLGKHIKTLIKTAPCPEGYPVANSKREICCKEDFDQCKDDEQLKSVSDCVSHIFGEQLQNVEGTARRSLQEDGDEEANPECTPGELVAGSDMTCLQVLGETDKLEIHHKKLPESESHRFTLVCRPAEPSTDSSASTWCAMGFGTGMSGGEKSSTAINTVEDQKKAFKIEEAQIKEDVDGFVTLGSWVDKNGVVSRSFTIPATNLSGSEEKADIVAAIFKGDEADWRTTFHSAYENFTLDLSKETTGSPITEPVVVGGAELKTEEAQNNPGAVEGGNASAVEGGNGKLWLDESNETGNCGASNLLPDGKTPAQCNPSNENNEVCCSSGGWCGNTSAHCTCPDCVSYANACGDVEDDDHWCKDSEERTCKKGETDNDLCPVPEAPKWITEGRCGMGEKERLSETEPGQCNPKSANGDVCCSKDGSWCGRSKDHCNNKETNYGIPCKDVTEQDAWCKDTTELNVCQLKDINTTETDFKGLCPRGVEDKKEEILQAKITELVTNFSSKVDEAKLEQKELGTLKGKGLGELKKHIDTLIQATQPAAQCEIQDGSFVNDGPSCICNNETCDEENGLVCNAESVTKCSKKPSASGPSGQWPKSTLIGYVIGWGLNKKYEKESPIKSFEEMADMGYNVVITAFARVDGIKVGQWGDKTFGMEETDWFKYDSKKNKGQLVLISFGGATEGPWENVDLTDVKGLAKETVDYCKLNGIHGVDFDLEGQAVGIRADDVREKYLRIRRLITAIRQEANKRIEEFPRGFFITAAPQTNGDTQRLYWAGAKAQKAFFDDMLKADACGGKPCFDAVLVQNYNAQNMTPKKAYDITKELLVCNQDTRIVMGYDLEPKEWDGNYPLTDKTAAGDDAPIVAATDFAKSKKHEVNGAFVWQADLDAIGAASSKGKESSGNKYSWAKALAEYYGSKAAPKEATAETGAEVPPTYPLGATAKIGPSGVYSESGCRGIITVVQASADESTVTYDIKGCKDAGQHGFHVHQNAITSDCKSTGGHYNPTEVDHGAHVGDLRNIQVDDSGNAEGEIISSVIKLHGEHSIVGRAFVLHEGTDDLGQGGDAGSLASGNAGGRQACGDITLGADGQNGADGQDEANGGNGAEGPQGNAGEYSFEKTDVMVKARDNAQNEKSKFELKEQTQKIILHHVEKDGEIFSTCPNESDCTYGTWGMVGSVPDSLVVLKKIGQDSKEDEIIKAVGLENANQEDLVFEKNATSEEYFTPGEYQVSFDGEKVNDANSRNTAFIKLTVRVPKEKAAAAKKAAPKPDPARKPDAKV